MTYLVTRTRKRKEEMETATPIRPVGVGDHVKVVTESYEERDALVTTVHGTFPEEGKPGFIPCINVVYISSDPAKRDPYGQQVERMSSLQHFSQGPGGMPKPGRFWVNAE